MITVTDLSLELDGRKILDGASFHVARGESLALVGPNGSGKTSLLRCLLGLMPFRGKATIGGYDVVRNGLAARALVGYVPQCPAFDDALAVEVLEFVAKLRRIDRARAVEALRAVGLEEHARSRVRNFSGGMQQRLSLAVALLGETPVMLLDEPTAYLDEEAQEQFLETIRGLRERGCTLLIASHRSEEIARLAERVALVKQGRIVEDEKKLVSTPRRVVSMQSWIRHR